MSNLAIANIHDALTDAITGKARYKRDPKENITVRLDPAKKEKAKEICEVSGTTASDFLRACVDRLLLDYMGPKEFAAFEAKIAKVSAD